MMVIGDFNGWSNRAATRIHDAVQSISALHHLNGQDQIILCSMETKDIQPHRQAKPKCVSMF